MSLDYVITNAGTLLRHAAIVMLAFHVVYMTYDHIFRPAYFCREGNKVVQISRFAYWRHGRRRGGEEIEK
ncbi:MAG: hypothetical protein GY805_11260 [Chloroflexi bacterium]|nr:hypothetical protein [Chloroflexota bacterium]